MSLAYPTPSLQFERQVSGTNANTWNDRFNAQWQRVENSIAGTVYIDMTSGSAVLTTTDTSDLVSDCQSRFMILVLTGTPSVSPVLVLPSPISKIWLVINDTSMAVNFQVTGQPGVTIQPSVSFFCYCNGTDIAFAQSTTPFTLSAVTLTAPSITNSRFTFAAFSGDHTAIDIIQDGSQQGWLRWYTGAATETARITPMTASSLSTFINTNEVMRLSWSDLGTPAICLFNTVLSPNTAGVPGATITQSGALDIYGSGNAPTIKVGAAQGTLLQFTAPGFAIVGSITRGSSSVSYNTTSDYRLKIVYGSAHTGALFDGLTVHDASYIGAPSTRRPMLLAHEAAEHAPWAVFGAKDEVTEDGEVKPQMIDYASFVPSLIAEVKSLRARLAAAGL